MSARGRRTEETVPAGYRIGDWEVTEQIGAGSWATVHAARWCGAADAGMPAEAAVKVFSIQGLAPRQARQLSETAVREVEFGREAAHPGLVRLIDTVVVSDPDHPVLDGAVVLVMERARTSLLEELTAHAAQAARSGDDGPEEATALPEAGRILTEICEALAHLHRSGWVHGDLKPANILLARDGSVRLADFGLAARIEGTHGYAPPVGSPDYLPPERWTEPLGERGVTVRTSLDVWAFGVTAHQLLTGGALPFPGATPAARQTALHEYAAGQAPLRLDRRVPERWLGVLADCLVADPAQRSWHSAEALLPRVRAAARSGRGGAGRWRRRLPVIGLAAAAAAALAVVLIAPWEQPEKPATVASAPVTVFNIETACQQQSERLRSCSLGLARDPLRKYDAANVVLEHRVWHQDILTADCVVYHGDRVADETGVGNDRWFRVLLPQIPSGHAWLPAVRTHDDPKLAECPSHLVP
ncbi:serine/threonine-protein kinase [Kitasatospora sp. NPDC051853]|uniref:serine/threonine-protein kinase n=1 Tax=Kitasatospora sp. NPDC051853 TaxID=3364058 RepID=UPI00379CD5A3